MTPIKLGLQGIKPLHQTTIQKRGLAIGSSCTRWGRRWRSRASQSQTL